jgi:hypothetical protein
MRKLLLVAAATLGLGACTYPDTQMTPVEPTATQTQTTEAPPPADDTANQKKPSAKR